MGDSGAPGRARPGRRRRLRLPRWSQLTAPPLATSPRLVLHFLAMMWASAGATLLLLAAVSLRAPSVVPTPASAAGGAVALGISLMWWRARRMTRLLLHGTLLLGLAIVTALVVAAGAPGSTGSAAAYVLGLLVAVSCTSWVGAAAYCTLTTSLVVAWQVLEPGDWAHTLVLCWTLVLCSYVVGRLLRTAAAAEVDGLTGLANRRGAERHLDDLAGSAGGVTASVAVIDLDHFKSVNDDLGHDAGDELLRRVRQALRSGVEDSFPQDARALVARWGGDEFVVAAAAAPSDLAAALDRSRALLPPGASCSAGVLALHPGVPPSRALTRADEALHQVKRGARGRTSIAG